MLKKAQKKAAEAAAATAAAAQKKAGEAASATAAAAEKKAGEVKVAAKEKASELGAELKASAAAKSDEVAAAAKAKKDDVVASAEAAASAKKAELKASAAARSDEVAAAAKAKKDEVVASAKASAQEKSDAVKAAATEKKDELAAAASEKKDELAAAVSEKSGELALAAAVKATAVKEGVKEEALESSEIEPTVHRRNLLLTINEGDVDAALGAVGKQYLLTGKLSKAAAASVPVMGLAYSTIGPLWDKMRDCCVIAALYGHDITTDEVQSNILQCVEQMMFEKGEGASGTAVVAKSVGKKVMARISAKSASAAAINSVPMLGAMVNVVIQKTIATELKEVQSVAMMTFRDGGAEIPREEYWIEDDETVSRRVHSQLPPRRDQLDNLIEKGCF